MRRAINDGEDLAGHDSFLDVVTNIVGILILLVMVVGLRSSHAVATAVRTREASQSAPAPVDERTVRAAFQATGEREREVRELVRRAYDSRQDAMLREQERMWLNEAVAEAEQEITERRAKLSDRDQRDYDMRRQLVEAQLKLDELTREQVALLSQEPETEEIRCEPTPIAKAVTGNEIHVLLAHDHLALAPIEELTQLMEADLRQNVWRLKQEKEMIRTIGPVNGFRLKYCFVESDFVAQSKGGAVATGKMAEFRGFFLLPVTSPLGEPAADALEPDSEFRQKLRRLDPTLTTITIWTYPGNYDRLRELKRGIREAGFTAAARPLPEGRPIGFSPSGSRSVSD